MSAPAAKVAVIARDRLGGSSTSSHTPTASRFSLARGATGAAPCKAPVDGGVGGPRVDRGSCAPPAGAVARRLALPEPRAPRDFPAPPLRSSAEAGGIDASARITHTSSTPGPANLAPAARSELVGTSAAGDARLRKGEVLPATTTTKENR